jgi:ribonuclease E
MEHSDDNKSAGSKADDSALPADQPAKQRQRGSRGGQKRKPASQRSDDTAEPNGKNDVEIPDRIREGKPSAEAGERGLVRKPKIGDTMPAQSNPSAGSSAKQSDHGEGEGEGDKKKRNRRSKEGPSRPTATMVTSRMAVRATSRATGRPRTRRTAVVG